MAEALRPSIEITNKQNVNPSINRITEATAEDFQELGQILIDHAVKLDALNRTDEQAEYYGIHSNLPVLQAAFPDAPNGSWAVIDPGNGNPKQIATVVNGVWEVNQAIAPILLYNTKLDRPSPGVEGIIYVVKDEKIFSLWYDGKYNDFGKDGANGLSAYQIAVAVQGFEGTETEWLLTLKGEDGRSAYQIALDNGFVGTEAEWIASVEGVEGKSAYEVAVANGFVGTEVEWLASLEGNDGDPGEPGAPGDPGENGLSAYEVAVANGFVGTEAEWLESLKGEKGDPGDGTQVQSDWAVEDIQDPAFIKNKPAIDPGGGTSTFTVQEKTSDFSLKATDAESLIRVNKANNLTAHFPHTDEEVIPLMKEIHLKPINTGALRFTASPGVELEVPTGYINEVYLTYDVISFRREVDNKWGVYGALKTGVYTPDPVAFGTAQTSSNGIYWPVFYKSSEWPEVTTAKNYFILYSSDHDGSSTPGMPGGLYWGEFDSFTGGVLNGFVERGLIRSGYQHETPYLVKIPTSRSGLAGETLFLYFHTDSADPSNIAGAQETHILTTTGGLLHTATYTDRGKPFALINNELHSGYARIYWTGTQYVAFHLAGVFGGSGVIAWSTSPDGINFTRQGIIDNTAGVPAGCSFHGIYINAFTYNSTKYAVLNIKDANGTWYLGLTQTDANYVPTTFVKFLSKIGDAITADANKTLRNSEFLIEGDLLRILYKTGLDNNDSSKPFYYKEFKLSELL